MYYSIKDAKGQGILNGASLRDMMHLLCKYDVAHFIRNDAMFSISLGEADNIYEVNIVSEAPSFAIRQTSLKKLLEKSQGVFLSFVSEKELVKTLNFTGFCPVFLYKLIIP